MVDAYRVWQFELVQLFSSLVSGWHGDACFWNNLIKVLLKKAACRLTNKQSLFNLKKASAILPLMDRHAHFYRLTDMRVRFSKPTDMTICPYRPTHMRTYSSNQEWASEEITFVYILIYTYMTYFVQGCCRISCYGEKVPISKDSETFYQKTQVGRE